MCVHLLCGRLNLPDFIPRRIHLADVLHYCISPFNPRTSSFPIFNNIGIQSAWLARLAFSYAAHARTIYGNCLLFLKCIYDCSHVSEQYSNIANTIDSSRRFWRAIPYSPLKDEFALLIRPWHSCQCRLLCYQVPR